MDRRANWLAVLLLAWSSTACVSTGLYQWAADEAPRSEVFGFVDRGGEGDALLVHLQGEPGCLDGVYWMPVARGVDGAPHSPPRRLEPEQERWVLEFASRSRHQARLATVGSSAQVDWLRVDAFDAAAASSAGDDLALHPITIEDRAYYASVAGPVQFAGASEGFTRVDVHRRRGLHEGYEARGSAYLPPARRVPGRPAVAVLAAPFAFAADVVLLPIQVVVFLLFTGDLDVGRVSGEVGASFDT